MTAPSLKLLHPPEPVEIRQKVFLEARKFQPVLPDSEDKKTVLQLAADKFESDAATSFRQSFTPICPSIREWSRLKLSSLKILLERYNLAQAQAILYKCVEMKIRVAPSDTANYRAIFGWIKHFGLIHSVVGSAGHGYEITLTGAASLFHRSQKYGVQMSVFLPALLLCKDWKMSAEISSKERGNAFYELTGEQDELTSCYFDEPEYKNSDIQKLLKNWEKSAADWQLTENRQVIDLGKTAVHSRPCFNFTERR